MNNYSEITVTYIIRCSSPYVHTRRCSRLYGECRCLRYLLSATGFRSLVSATLRFCLSADSTACKGRRPALCLQVYHKQPLMPFVATSTGGFGVAALGSHAYSIPCGIGTHTVQVVLRGVRCSLSFDKFRAALDCLKDMIFELHRQNRGLYISTSAVGRGVHAVDRDAERYLDNDNCTIG